MHQRKQYCILEIVKVPVGHNVKKRYNNLLYIGKYAALRGGQQQFLLNMTIFLRMCKIENSVKPIHSYLVRRLTSSNQFSGHF